MAAKFDATLVKRYDMPGPRYTSYPTALQFGSFNVADFDEAITESTNENGNLFLD